MKPILYIGAALMFGAGIYGFVDYKKKGHSKEFQSLYKGKQKKEVRQPVTANKAQAAIVAFTVTEKKATVVADKKEVAGSKQVVEKKNKELSSKQFSRAALEGEEVPLPEPENKVKQ